MNYYVFQVSDQSNYAVQKTAQEVFDTLVRDKSVWGFGPHTPNRKAIAPGDKVLFYLTGTKNQVFVGAATLKSGVYDDSNGDSKDWFLTPETLRIDLEDVVIFPDPRPRQSFMSLEWRPAQGGSAKISERDYELIMGYIPDNLPQTPAIEQGSEFVLEKYLEQFIVENWDKINFGEKLDLYVDADGNSGRQYYTEEVGYIDILARNEQGDFIVIELKKGRKDDEVVGQILRYMGWVRRNLANGSDVKGLIIVGDRDKKLEYALGEIGSNKIRAQVYQMRFSLEDY